MSRVPKGDRKLKAALLLVCWADGFGAVEGAHVLADAGLARRRTFQVIIDELWQVIGSGSGIVDRIDVLVRVENRGSATQAIFVTHSVADLSAFESTKDANKALGFLEKARLKFIGPVGPEELDRLSTVTHINAAERELLTSAASTPPPSESVLSRLRAVMRRGGGAASSVDRPRPHGQGVFLLKHGEDKRPGIPFRLNFTPAEETGVHNTNNRFDGVTTRAGDASRIGGTP